MQYFSFIGTLMFINFFAQSIADFINETMEEEILKPFNVNTSILNSNEVEMDDQSNDEKRLVEYLMRNYDNKIRPVRNANRPVNILLGITLTQIFDLDEKNQVLTTNVWLDQEWIDEFLAWNSSEFGNLKKLRLPCEKLCADDYTRGYMNSRAMIEPNGNVFWPPPTKFRSTCKVDVTYFPFDDQICIMKLGSWSYDGLQVDVHNRTADVDLTNYIKNGEWDLREAKIAKNVVYYSCCLEPFPDVTITMLIRRKTLYYMYNVVLPCMMMSVLTLLVFCLPPDSGEKIALGVTVLLAFSVFMLAISEKLPETSESIPLLGIYLTAVMAITSVSVIMTVIVLNFHYRGPITKKMPNWVRKYLLEKVIAHNHSRPAPTSSNAKDSRQGSNDRRLDNYPIAPPSSTSATAASSSFSSHLIRSAADAVLRGISVDANTGSYSSCPNQNVTDEFIGLHDFGSNSGSSNNIPSTRNELRNKNTKTKSHYSSPPRQNNANIIGSDSGDSKMNPQEEMLKILRYLLWRQELEDQHNKMVHEWRLLALAIDKVLFWVFLIITVVSSLSFLVIIPIQRRGIFGFEFA